LAHHALVFALPFALLACPEDSGGGGGAEGPDGGRFLVACDQPKLVSTTVKSCTDHYAEKELDIARMGVEMSCKILKGTVLEDPCPKAGATGGCLIRTAGTSDLYGLYSIEYFYTPVTEASARKTCESGGHEFIPGEGQADAGAKVDADADAGRDAGTTRDAGASVEEIPRFEAKAIAAGTSQTCALTTEGEAMCWGQIYGGATGSELKLRPERVEGIDTELREILVGNNFNCAVTVTGEYRCWGTNQFGEAGFGDTMRHLTPALPSAINGLVSSLFVGEGSFSCGVNDAGKTYCWGNNVGGQLGNGTRVNSPQPVEVKDLPASKSVALGSFFACALTNAGGVQCWGQNYSGNLGNGTKTDSNTPVQVTGLEAGVTQLAAAHNYACVITDAQKVLCWGRNNDGQLGNRSGQDAFTPIEVEGLPGNIMQVVMGVNYAQFALGDDGTVWGWGTAGMFDAESAASLKENGKPIKVKGVPKGVVQLAGGGAQICALTEGGAVWCWGGNTWGAVGNGTKVAVKEPVQVSGP
jgi:alpha-tubulin suppressor-like RCC1 family protein